MVLKEASEERFDKDLAARIREMKGTPEKLLFVFYGRLIDAARNTKISPVARQRRITNLIRFMPHQIGKKLEELTDPLPHGKEIANGVLTMALAIDQLTRGQEPENKERLRQLIHKAIEQDKDHNMFGGELAKFEENEEFLEAAYKYFKASTEVHYRDVTEEQVRKEFSKVLGAIREDLQAHADGLVKERRAKELSEFYAGIPKKIEVKLPPNEEKYAVSLFSKPFNRKPKRELRPFH